VVLRNNHQTSNLHSPSTYGKADKFEANLNTIERNSKKNQKLAHGVIACDLVGGKKNQTSHGNLKKKHSHEMISYMSSLGFLLK
jgi:hypothetical protein